MPGVSRTREGEGAGFAALFAFGAGVFCLTAESRRLYSSNHSGVKCGTALLMIFLSRARTRMIKSYVSTKLKLYYLSVYIKYRSYLISYAFDAYAPRTH